MKINIAIVEDKQNLRTSLAERINFSDEINVSLTACDGEDFLEQMKRLTPAQRPALVLMDIEMPLLDGIETVWRAKLQYPDIHYLMLTVFDDDEKIFESIRAGAGGYLLKDEKVSTIIENIQQMLEVGAVPMSAAIARKTWNLLMAAPAKHPEELQAAGLRSLSSSGLSERETEVLKEMVKGLDYKGIAQKMFLSTHTVRKHIANIYAKLHVNSKAQAINMAHKKNWV